MGIRCGAPVRVEVFPGAKVRVARPTLGLVLAASVLGPHKMKCMPSDIGMAREDEDAHSMITRVGLEAGVAGRAVRVRGGGLEVLAQARW